MVYDEFCRDYPWQERIDEKAVERRKRLRGVAQASAIAFGVVLIAIYVGSCVHVLP